MDPLLPKRLTQSRETTNLPLAVPVSGFNSSFCNNLGEGITSWLESIAALELLLFRDAAADASQQIEELLNSATQADEKLLAVLAVADLLHRRQRFTEALSLLVRASEWPGSPDLQLWLASTRVRLHLQLNQPQDAWRLTESLLPQSGTERPEDIGVYMQWLTGMMELNQWVRWREMKPRIERFLGEAVQQNPVLILSALEKTYSAYLNSGCLRETRVVQSLALHAVRRLKNPDTQVAENGSWPFSTTHSRFSHQENVLNQRKETASILHFDKVSASRRQDGSFPKQPPLHS